MVRVPSKTCPNLSRLFDDVEPELLAEFFRTKPFEKFGWLKKYRADEGPSGEAPSMLSKENKNALIPIESEAARIITIASTRGQFALEGLASLKLEPDRLGTLRDQVDELARSLWTFINETALFEATENSLHLRLYRRYDKHYQTFMAEPLIDGGTSGGSATINTFLTELGAHLDRGEGYSIDRFDDPGSDDEPATEMYLLFHPNPSTSVREIDELGNLSKTYIRPPGEAMIVAADQPDSGIDDNQVAGNVLTMLLAGEDTTANTLAWCIWLLHEHPAALARAQAEARSVMADGGPVTLDHLARLDYIEACMNETMRLKPVAPQLPQQALKDLAAKTIDGTVPNARALARMSSIWFV